jgi:hypothetical protein
MAKCDEIVCVASIIIEIMNRKSTFSWRNDRFNQTMWDDPHPFS